MKIFEKYVLKSYISSFFFCITLLMVLGIIGDVLGFLDDIFKNNIPVTSILAFYAYLAPFAFVNMIPFACLLSSVYVFNSLSKNHELTAVIASGVSLWKLLRPVIIVTFLLCMVTFIVNDKVVPWTMKRANTIRHEEIDKSKDKSGKTSRDLAVYGEGDQLIFAKSFVAGTNTLNDVIIHRQDANHRVNEKINASSIKWQKDGSWVGKDVIVFKADSKGKFSGDPEMYKEKKIFIGERPEAFINNQWDPKFMNYKELKRYLTLFKNSSASTVRRLLVDLNYKIAFPFTALITVMIGVPFSVETGRASALIGMARGITIAILYLPVMAICLALGKGGILPPVLSAWMSNIIFLILGIYYIDRKS